MAQNLVTIAKQTLKAQPVLLEAQQKYGGQFAAAEAQAAGQRAGAEAQVVRQQYPGYRDAMFAASPEYAAGAQTFRDRTAAGANLYGMLEAQAADELARGASLTPDEQREAMQAARAAYSARGLGTGNQAAIAEILGRSQLANQRLRERQTFAGQVANQGMAYGTQAVNTAGAQFDPFQRIFGQGGSQASGTLSSGEMFAPFGGIGADLARTDAMLAQIASQEKMFKQGQDFSKWATMFNAGEARYLGDQNAGAARSAANKGFFGNIFGSAAMAAAIIAK